MAGLGRRTFAAGEVLTASNVMGYLQDQAVMNFATETARNTAIASPWQGATAFIQDKGYLTQYFDLYNASTNTGGVSVAGWYPVAGNLPKALARRSTTAVTLSNTWVDRSATTNWTTYFAHNVAAYNAGWVVPVTGVYEISAAIAASDAVAVAVAPNTAPTGQTSSGIVLSLVGGASSFSTGTARGLSKARLTAGDVMKISVTSLSSSTWFTTSTTLDGNHFGITYISPPFGA